MKYVCVCVCDQNHKSIIIIHPQPMLNGISPVFILRKGAERRMPNNQTIIVFIIDDMMARYP